MTSLSKQMQDFAEQVGEDMGHKAQEDLSNVTPGFGAVGDGVANDAAALASRDAAGGTVLLAGTYRVASALALANPLTILPGLGGKIRVDGVTLTINGPLSAGHSQIFDCINGGLVVIDPSATPEARPEWWGATPNTGADCYAAIMAALTAHGVVRLQSSPYFISHTLILDKSNQALLGTRNVFVSPGQTSCTRIIMASASMTIIQLGPSVFPGTINSCPFGIRLENFLAQRDRAPDGPSNATGIRVGYCVQSRANEVRVADSIFGWHFRGSVAFIGCQLQSARAEACTGGSDRFLAFYADGNDSATIGASGGNASLRLTNIFATGTTLVADCRGFVADHYFTDLFVRDLETVGCPVGIDIAGQAGSSLAQTVGNTDCLFEHPVIDGYTTNGIRVSTVNQSGSVEIVAPYAAPAAGVSGAAIRIDTCAGRVAVRGGQLPMYFGTGNGVEIVGSTGAAILGTMILECSGIGVYGYNANQCDIQPQTSNFIQAMTAVVEFETGCNGNFVRASALGASGKIPVGYKTLDATSNYNEFNCTGLRSTIITGGAANKLVNNGTQITSAGAFGTNNLASGVMA